MTPRFFGKSMDTWDRLISRVGGKEKKTNTARASCCVCINHQHEHNLVHSTIWEYPKAILLNFLQSLIKYSTNLSDSNKTPITPYIRIHLSRLPLNSPSIMGPGVLQNSVWGIICPRFSQVIKIHYLWKCTWIFWLSHGGEKTSMGVEEPSTSH